MAVINFALMTKLIIIAVCACLLGCVSSPVTSAPDELIGMAKREISRRHIQLPSDCDITVDEGLTAPQIGPARELYFVRFTFTRAGKRDVYYKVIIEKRSRKVEQFLDYRETIPGGHS